MAVLRTRCARPNAIVRMTVQCIRPYIGMEVKRVLEAMEEIGRDARLYGNPMKLFMCGGTRHTRKSAVDEGR